MALPILTTKLHIPSPNPSLTPRPRLLKQINRGLEQGHRLTLVSAPAGFGKTTLISVWLNSIERPSAWISFDESDNDPSRFWTYFITALRKIHPDIGEIALEVLQSTQTPFMESLLTSLINEIHDRPTEFSLVLDDFHFIKAQAIHNDLTFLLEHLPPQMHLVIISRADPPLPLARMRARGQLGEVRTTDLRFTSDEAASFLNQTMGLGLSANDIDALEKRTEGWIVGLQMAALSMQGRQDAASFISAFTGSNRYVLDYLTEDVLHRQPSDIQSFLIETSILNRLTGTLCDAVTRRQDGRETLKWLEANNLFVVPLDYERQWYRYHQLFADLLRNCLGRTYPDQVADLHRRASAWFEQEMLIDEAIDHAFYAADSDLAARLIEGNTLRAFGQGAFATIQSWIKRLPKETRLSRPRIGIYFAGALFALGQRGSCKNALQDVEKALPPAEKILTHRNDTGSVRANLTDNETAVILAEVAIVRAHLAISEGDSSLALEFSRQALALAPKDNPFLYKQARLCLGNALYEMGDPAGAIEALTGIPPLLSGIGDDLSSAVATILIAQSQVLQARLDEAEETCQQALETDSEHRVRRVAAKSILYIPLSTVMCERNDLDAAEKCILQGIGLGEPGGYYRIVTYGYLNLALVKYTKRDLQGAVAALKTAYQAAKRMGMHGLIDQIASHQARLSVAEGDLTAANRWAREHEPFINRKSGYTRELEYLTLARVHLTQSNPKEALQLLTEAGQAAEGAGRTGSLIEILVLQAIALQMQGNVDQALIPLERALALGEPNGYVQTFISEGKPMEELLRQAVSRGISPDYATTLLAAFGKSSGKLGGAIILGNVDQSVIESLTERELQVLRLICTGMSNQQIAQQLMVVEGTVKTHISNIFGKLDVHNRTHAIARAKELGILK